MSSNGRQVKLRNGLTPKQDAFKNQVLKQIKDKKAINGTKAALEVYDTNNSKTAQNIASDNMRNPIIKDAMESALSQNGITEEAILKNIHGLAESAPQKLSGDTILKANLSLLKLLGHDGSGKKGKSSLTVNNTIINIGYDEAKAKLKSLDSDSGSFMTEADIL